MEVEDRTTIVTPEGIELSLALASIGSRFIAGTADLLLQVALIGLIGLLAGSIGAGQGIAIFAVGGFAAFYLYDVLFEILAAGQTPGKRITHLRVVREHGEPIDLPSSAVRNLVRLLEGPPFLYLPAVCSIAITRRNQRIGDLAAGSLVIRIPVVDRDRRATAPHRTEGDTDPGRGQPPDERWDLSAVSVEELAAVRLFLERRAKLDVRARAELALRLEHGLRDRVAGVPEQLSGERFLERLAAAKAARRS